jgi:hypothetical protein
MFWQKENAGDTRYPSEASGGRRRRKKPRAPPEPAVIEPDRPSHRQMPPGELLNEPFEYTETPPSEMLNALDNSSYFPHPSSDVEEDTVYKLEPDWAKPFNDVSAPDWIKERMPKRDAETPLTPSPWMDGQPSLWQSVPDGLRTQYNLGGSRLAAEDRADALERRLNSMFAKLDDIEAGRLANNHMELLMFIIGGFFLLLLLDLLVKQGTQASILLAAAGGRPLFSGGGKGLLWM